MLAPRGTRGGPRGWFLLGCDQGPCVLCPPLDAGLARCSKADFGDHSCKQPIALFFASTFCGEHFFLGSGILDFESRKGPQKKTKVWKRKEPAWSTLLVWANDTASTGHPAGTGSARVTSQTSLTCVPFSLTMAERLTSSKPSFYIRFLMILCTAVWINS